MAHEVGMMAAAHPSEIAICGAGPVGAMLALLLADQSSEHDRIAIIDARLPGNPPSDTRRIALSYGSRVLLDRVGVWHDTLGVPIHSVHVSRHGRFGRTQIDSAECGVAALGYVCAYADLVAAFDARLASRALTSIRPRTVVSTLQTRDHVLVTLSDAKTVKARYAVHAEGGIYGAQSQRPVHRDYRQSAVTAFVTCEHSQPGIAFERFTDSGPIALLPTRHDGHDTLSLVWCLKPEDAQSRLECSDQEFLAELYAAFGDRLGHFTSVSHRAKFPLGLNAAREVVNGREAAIGNAAQTLHPVAGQGLNLGLRDAFSLAQAFRECGEDPTEFQRQFQTSRRADRMTTVYLTDLLAQAFTTRFAPVSLAGAVTMLALDLVPLFRHGLAWQMMNGRR